MMNFKTITLPLFALAFSVSIVGCNSEKSEKDGDATETEQEEKMETDGIKTVDTATTALPAAEITLDLLPAVAKDFIAKNYPSYTLVKAASDPLCGGGDAIDVAISKAGTPNLSLIFTPDGTFVQQEEDVLLSTANAKIKDTLKAKYGGYSAGTQIEKLILADNTVQYLVDLSKGNVTKEVIFTTDGTVVCEN